MAYIDKEYLPTVWENEITLIDSIKMNKIEEALANLQYAESLRFGTLRRSVLPMASFQESDALSTTLVGVVQLSNRHTPGGVAVAGQKTFAATPYAVSQAYANSAAIDMGTPAARIAKESVDAQRLKSAITVNFVGAQVSGNQLSIRNGGSAIDANLVVIKDAHIHSTKSIEAQASASARGFVRLSQDFTGIAVDVHSDTVPTAKLFKDEVNKVKQSIASEAERINVANTKINNLLTVNNVDGTKFKQAVDNANNSKSWIDGFTADGGKLLSIESEILGLGTKSVADSARIDSALAANKKVLDLSADIANSKLSTEIAKGVSAKSWIDSATSANGILTNTTNELTSLKASVTTNTKGIASTNAKFGDYLTISANEEQKIQTALDIQAVLVQAQDLIAAQSVVIQELELRVAALEGTTPEPESETPEAVSSEIPERYRRFLK